MANPRCAICLRKNKPKFKTPRITICTRCVNLLNATDLSPRQATELLRQKLLANVVHKHGDDGNAGRWVNRRFPGILDEWCKDPERKGVPIKVVRAYRRELVCLDRSYLDYPSDWLMLAYRHKHRDGYACNVCGLHDEGGGLQAHHIVFRSRSGTNYASNIVVLCLKHHQAQHPDHDISAAGGEGPGVYANGPTPSSEDVECQGVIAPPSLWIPEAPTMPPRHAPRPPEPPVELPCNSARLGVDNKQENPPASQLKPFISAASARSTTPTASPPSITVPASKLPQVDETPPKPARRLSDYLLILYVVGILILVTLLIAV